MAMRLPATRPFTGTGHAFAIDDHAAIADWAARNHYRAVVALDHGVGDEDYEEVIELRFGSRCLVLIWRDANGVVVQPLIGRSRQYGTVPEALDSCRPPARRERQARRGRLPVNPSRSGALRRTPA
jgi:hypothetical protein